MSWTRVECEYGLPRPVPFWRLGCRSRVNLTLPANGLFKNSGKLRMTAHNRRSSLEVTHNKVDLLHYVQCHDGRGFGEPSVQITSLLVVTALTLSSEASPFMGFLIKAFDEDEKDVGSFRSTGPDSRAFSHCSGITHTSKNLKKRVVVQWLAPDDRSGKVHFKVTVVKEFKDYYHAIPSTLA
ncbi:hypothetical protein HPB47_014822 [Ixodes persulcatus]|uniref:Uncharacterized protein n=1 Tax=Ixodes persulcatus TaxID=34615 RepID=A0AC60QV05_IXOPE|nr:hypothetical protein HPB47_014822 [Ixodes persulcatus]